MTTHDHNTWMTRTWQRRLDRGGGIVRTTATIIGFAACSVVALNVIWGWFTSTPIDVAGPAQATVNHTDYIKSYAEKCIRRLLTVTQDQRNSLLDCWTQSDLAALPASLPATAPVLVDSARTTKIWRVARYPEAEQWQVIVEVSERPYLSAPAHTSYKQLSILFSKYGRRVIGLPASVSVPGSGATLPMAYGVSLPVSTLDATGAAVATKSLVSDTVIGFLTSYLTPAGGLDRYAAASSGIQPVADCTAIHVTALLANTATPDQTVPDDGTTVKVLATVSETTTAYGPRSEQYPLTLTVSSSTWAVTAIDPSPVLVGTADLAPVAPATPGR